MGRARAWFRLALMQKKLPEYFKVGKPGEICLGDFNDTNDKNIMKTKTKILATTFYVFTVKL